MNTLNSLSNKSGAKQEAIVGKALDFRFVFA